jgi:hypothetical protein
VTVEPGARTTSRHLRRNAGVVTPRTRAIDGPRMPAGPLVMTTASAARRLGDDRSGPVDDVPAERPLLGSIRRADNRHYVK